MGLVIIPIGILSFVVSVSVGMVATTIASLLLIHREGRSSWRIFGAWLLGAVVAGLLWWRLIEWLVPSRLLLDVQGEGTWSIAVQRFVMQAAWPGALLLGGAIGQLLRALLTLQRPRR